MNSIHRFLSLLAWLQIFISPAIIGTGIGTLIWLAMRGSWGIVSGLIIGLLGCATGVLLAEKARRGKGTIEFMARNIAHPELHEEEK